MKKLLFLGAFINIILLVSCSKQNVPDEKFEGVAFVSYDYGTNNINNRTDTFEVKVNLIDATNFSFTWLNTTSKGKYEIKSNGNYIFNTGNCEDNSWCECCLNCNCIGTPILGEFQSKKKDNTLKLSKEIKNVISNNWNTTILLERVE